ncbi:MAG: FIST C-terminal domain-containing protein [Candidatus Omnitrophica bacterium]|nr:FIST C-terminal domain-containing protein [Candidatus Omnitrophota bacterium]MCB9719632.1 FIST C-terminal domain-containing protein [Candidatus Omnitrophota bacterium]
MSTHIGIGFSQNIDMHSAARDAAFEAKTNLRQDHIDLAIVFSSIHYDPHEILPVVRQVLNSQRLIGSSTAGIIRDTSVAVRGIGVLTISSTDIQFGIASTQDRQTNNPVELGAELANDVIKDHGQSARQAFLFFMDDKLRWTSELLRGLQGIFGNIFPIVGAGSSDDFHFGNTYQFYQDEIFYQSVTGVLMGGQMSVGVAGRHGWRPLGKPRIIDEAEYNVIKTIDGQKASSLYDEYFGEYAQDLRSDKLGRMAILYPLGVYVEGSNEYLLRNTVDILSDGSIVCQGDVPVGSEVHIMIGNKDSCQTAAHEAAMEAQKNLLGKPARLVIVIECLSRLKLLGRGAYRELQQVREVFGENVPMFGMYSNGEVCPFQTTERFKKPHHQNESIVILAIA